MKKVELLQIKDGNKFYISPKTKIVYTVIREGKDFITVNADLTNKSFNKQKNLMVFPI